MRQFNNSTIQQFNNSDGVTLYLAIVTMSGALAIALFMSSVFIKELRISQDIVNSIKAVYVADTMMEYALYQARANATLTNTATCIPGLSGSVQCSATSDLNVIINSETSPNPQCTSVNYPTAATCTKIVVGGSYSGINRRIEIVYPNL